jgi:rod shape-determining protein MreC
MFWSVKHPTPIENLVMDGLLKVASIETSALKGLRNLWEGIIALQYLSQENSELRAMVGKLLREKVQYEDALRENERLRSLLGYRERIPYRTVVAEVIGYDPSNWFHSLILNRGSRDGVRKDQTVIGCLGMKGGLVGRITDVEDEWSKALLILDLNSRVGAKIQRTQLKGVLEGLNKRVCRLKYIYENADVEVGDTVLTSGTGGIFREGIPIGKIVEVMREDGRIFLDVYVLPFIKFARLEEVLIIIEAESG